MMRMAAIGVATVLCLVVAACDDDDGRAADGSRKLDEGEMLGRIDRLPGGTPVPVETRLFREATCSNGLLTVRLAAETVTAEMDCSRMLQQVIIAAFREKDVALTFRPGRLIIENPEAGTMEFPADDARVKEDSATP